MSDRYADEACPFCGEPMDDHERQRDRQEDGQYTFRTVCP